MDRPIDGSCEIYIADFSEEYDIANLKKITDGSENRHSIWKEI
jgi:hypothetical protein